MKKKCILMIAAFCMLTGLFCGCGRSGILSKKSLIEADDPFIQEMTGIERKKLRKVWDEPFFTVGNQDIWEETADGENIYIAATYDEQDKVVVVNRSYPLYVVVADVSEGRRLGIFSNADYAIESGNLFFIPDKDIQGREIPLAVGDRLYFAYSGLVMETFPAQISAPYAFEKTGVVTDEEMAQIEEIIADYEEMFSFD